MINHRHAPVDDPKNPLSRPDLLGMV